MGETAGMLIVEEDCAGQQLDIGAECYAYSETITAAACLNPHGQTPFGVVSVFFRLERFLLGKRGWRSRPVLSARSASSTSGTPVVLVEYTFGILCGDVPTRAAIFGGIAESSSQAFSQKA
jgi:hypothetical protein